MMPTLGVCGDSFMAATIDLNHREDCRDSEGKHFTEILSKKIGYDYFTLARGACSNTAIRLQISEMVQAKVDLVIIGMTSPGRLEFPNIHKSFDKRLGVYNLDYRSGYYPDQSSQNTRFRHNLISDTLTNIFHDDTPSMEKIFNVAQESGHPKISTEQLKALEYYIDYIMDHEYKKTMDGWAIHSGIKLMEENHINFILVKNEIASEMPEYKNCNTTRFIDLDSPLHPHRYQTSLTNRRWHTTDQAQAILAELWHGYVIANAFV